MEFDGTGIGPEAVEEAIREGRIATRWQPICSVKKKCIVGFEALSFGQDSKGRPISPAALFETAEEKRLTLELDRLCRTKAVENFCGIKDAIRHATLFLNLDTSIIDRGVVGSGHLSRTVERAGLDPRQIAVEIVESRTASVRALKEFIETYRANGFLICLDDVGAGYSNLDRIAQLKPDLVKIDRLLTGDMAEYHSREVFRALVDLAHATGALVVAEGVETEVQALVALELGADMLQGYYLAKPQTVTPAAIAHAVEISEQLAEKFRAHVLDRLVAKSARHQQSMAVLQEVLDIVRDADADGFDAILESAVADRPAIEFAYVVTDSGVQITQTVGQPRPAGAPVRFLFEPAQPGTDHGLKDYVMLLNSGHENCVTEPYISLASGNVCQTCAGQFSGQDGQKYILCIDLAAESI